MPLLFAYGILQQEEVQRSIFGRLLRGARDELVGFEPSSVPIEDPRVVGASGRTPQASVRFTGQGESRVGGTRVEVTDAELAAADRSEAPAGFGRVRVTLASEAPAWVYVDAGFASGLYDTLARLGADPERAVYLRPGAGEAAILNLQRAARTRLGEQVPESFVRLLRLTNGAQINGAFFKEAENLVLENLDVPRPDLIVLGNAGNVDEYVFDTRDRHFHIVTFGFEDERVASFRTFEELLLRVFRDQEQIK
jgi:Gamma-glutamyl cyclotransferase, AIG2-like